ncbi:MAG: type II toxin-antitoxin system HicB family antitoxin [Clostridiales bacterium]|jgi:predicted RNase H-like HicB family nuclease|nr:type II toxin-antitoxin system HicB family antitoxin [Clostridiales bacterium]
MKYVYPAVFSPDEGMYCIYFPDIGMGATQGDDMADGIMMAEDFLAGALCHLEDAGMEIPKASSQKEIEGLADTKEGDIITFVRADTATYRRALSNQTIRKTLSIPVWLHEKAIHANINFSQTLQKALQQELQMAE